MPRRDADDFHPLHAITVCVSCRRPGGEDRPGRELIARLRAALGAEEAGGDAPTDRFCVSGVACMAGCGRPCTVAYRAQGKATYLFGDVGANDAATAPDVEALVAFARQYAALDDGWCSSTQRPERLSGRTLARVPALPADAS